MSSKIGVCILFKPPCELPTYRKQPTPLPGKKEGGLLGGSVPCLSALVFLCNRYIAEEAALFGSFEGTFLERTCKAFITDLGEILEAWSQGQRSGGKGRLIRRVCPKVEGTNI